MKRCPTCNSTFDDESLSYCINDGTVLEVTAQPGPENRPTAVYAEPPPTTNMPPPPTQMYGGLQTPSQPSPQPYGWAGEQPAWRPPPPPVTRGGPQQGIAITSLVLGLVSMTVGWCCYFGVLTAPVAIGMGIFSLVQIKNNPDQYTCKPLAITGIITGGLYFVVLVLIIILYGVAFLMGGLK